MPAKQKTKRRRPVKALCPLCDAPVDRRTQGGKDAVSFRGKLWHPRCLRSLVTAESLIEAQRMLVKASEMQTEIASWLNT